MPRPPCWQHEQVNRIVKPDAEEIEDHVFRAIHSPTRLRISATADSPTVDADGEELVKQFLDPKRNYVQAVVKGDSGTGKSHLIQWLRLQIPSDPKTVALTIPKAGTSLRGIVERLILELPTDERARFLSRLAESGTQTASHAAKIDLFLNALAWSIEHGVAAVDEIDKALKQLLPNVFMDPNFRGGFFKTPGGTVDTMVKHIFDPPEGRNDAPLREFQEGDLPLDGRLYQKAAGPSKDAIDFINGEAGLEMRAVNLINRSLQSAVAQTLNFSADSLIELMNALRRHLERQGKRLILLIEDFARLQGIDTALLQALITPPGQGSERLCELRWAMAVTTGYFLRIDATVRTRANIVVDMDSSAPASIVGMAAAYLNAVRVGESQLLALGPTEKVPVVCTGCNQRQDCFANFGQHGDIGLFPFTEKAISVMGERTNSIVGQRFNPRRFLRTVIEPVLDRSYQEILHGAFPSRRFLESVGGPAALKPVDQHLIASQDGDELGERRIALLELWDGSGKIVNLAEGIHDAFAIPLFRGARISDSSIDGGAKGATGGDTRRTADPVIAQLQAWDSEKHALPQATVNMLRGLVYGAIDSYIDWDAIGLRRRELANPSGSGAIPFRRLSINFDEQQVQASISLVALTLPLDRDTKKDRRETTLALQALVLYERFKTFDFPDGEVMLPVLMDKLEAWSAFVVKRIRSIYAASDVWNPAVAAAELLALGVQQAGKHSVEARADALAARVWDDAIPSALPGLTVPFERINRKLVENWPKLQTVVRLFCSGTKGGQSGNFVNPTSILSAVKSLRQRGLVLKQEPPSEAEIPLLKALGDLYAEVKGGYLKALEDERAAWLSWIGEKNAAIGPENSVQQFVEAIRDCVTAFQGAGLTAGAASGRVIGVLDSVNGGVCERAREHLSKLETSSRSEILVRIAAATRARQALDDLVASSDAFLTASDIAVRNCLIEEERKAGPGFAQSREVISTAIASLIAATDPMAADEESAT